MTPRLRQICGYELCIIPLDIKTDLNRFITTLVTYLQHNSFRRHTCNSLFSTTSAAHYKNKVFPDGECLHDTIKDADQCITCISIKPNNMILIKCALYFCDEYPEYNIMYE